MLEGVYRSVNDGRHLVDILEIRSPPPTPPSALASSRRWPTLREALGQKELAFAARVRVFAETPENAESREQVERLAARLRRFEELAAAYEDQLERGVTNATSTELFRRLSAPLLRAAGAPGARGEAPTRSSPGASPKTWRCWTRWRGFHSRPTTGTRWPPSPSAMVMAEPSPTKQIDLLCRLGDPGRGDAGRQAAGRAVPTGKSSPGSRTTRTPSSSWARCSPRASAGRSWPRSSSGKSSWPTPPAATRRCTTSWCAWAGCAWPGCATRAARWTSSRTCCGASRATPGAIGALEEMARSDSPLRGEAAEALEPIFTSGGDHLRLVQMLESRASTEPVAQERAALLRKVAKLYAGPMQNADLAFVSASRALRELPDEEASLTLAVDALRPGELTAGEELAALLEEILPRASRTRPGSAILRALGRTQEDARSPRTRPSTPGAGCWRRCPRTARPWGAWSGCTRPAGRAPELLEIYKRQLAISEDAAVRAALLFQHRRAPRRRPARHRGGDGHAAAAAGAEARRRPGPGAAGRPLREAAALAGAGGRHRTAAGAARRRTSTSTSAPGWRWSARLGSSTSSERWSCTGRC